MFVLSVNKKGLKKYLLVALLLIALFISAELFISSNKKQDKAVCNGGEYSLAFDSDSAKLDFISQFGFDKKPDEVFKDKVTIPHQFNKTYQSYNELQLLQGLDLSKYKGESVDRYYFAVRKNDVSTDDTIKRNSLYLCVLSKDGTVIGGHLESGLQSDKITTFFGEKTG